MDLKVLKSIGNIYKLGTNIVPPAMPLHFPHCHYTRGPRVDAI